MTKQLKRWLIGCLAIVCCFGTICIVAHHAVDQSSVFDRSDAIIAARMLSIERINPELAYLQIEPVSVYKGNVRQGETRLPVNVGPWGLPGVATAWPSPSTNRAYILFLKTPPWYGRVYHLLKVTQNSDSWQSYLRSQQNSKGRVSSEIGR
jgi:hypothetical protein